MKDEHPFDGRQDEAQRMDPIDRDLKRRHAVEHRGVGEQVDDQVAADRHQAGQRKQAIDQKLMAREERLRRAQPRGRSDVASTMTFLSAGDTAEWQRNRLPKPLV